MILQGEFERSQGIRYEFDRFLHHIGEGGMGVVYKGVMIDDNTNAILRDVAIKEVLNHQKFVVNTDGTTQIRNAIKGRCRLFG